MTNIAIDGGQQAYRKLSSRLTLTFTVLGVLISVLILAALVLTVSQQLREELKADAKTLVTLFSEQLDGDLHQTISAAEHQSHPAYTQLQDQLMQMRAMDDQLGFVYTQRFDDTGLRYVVDSALNENLREPGEQVTRIAPVLNQVKENLNESLTENGFRSDALGRWLSAYAPIYTSEGDLDGFLTIEFSTQRVDQQEQLLFILAALSLLIAIVLSYSIGHFLGKWLAKPLITLQQGMNRVADGHFTHRLHSQNKDAFGLLAESFNHMAQQIVVTQQRQENRIAEKDEIIERIYHRRDVLARQQSTYLFQFNLRSDGQRHMPYASDEFRRIYQVFEDDSQMAASTFFNERLDRDSREAINDAITLSAGSMETIHRTVRMRTPDGAEYWADFSAYPIRQEDGELLWEAQLLDLTTLKRAERAREQAQTNLFKLLESSPLGIAISRPQSSELLFANTPLQDFLQLDRETYQGAQLSRFYAESSQYHHVTQQFLTEKAVYGQTVRLKRGEDDSFQAKISLIPIQFDGEAAVLTSCVDLSGPKQVETTLKQQEQQLETAHQQLQHCDQELSDLQALYQAVSEVSADAILIHDANGEILECNSGACALFQQQQNHLKGKTLPTLGISDSQRKLLEKHLQNLADTDELQSVEASLQRGEDGLFPAEMLYQRFSRGEQHLYSVCIRDLSERQGYEDRLDAYSEQLEHCEEERQLVANQLEDIQGERQQWLKEQDNIKRLQVDMQSQTERNDKLQTQLSDWEQRFNSQTAELNEKSDESENLRQELKEIKTRFETEQTASLKQELEIANLKKDLEEQLAQAEQKAAEDAELWQILTALNAREISKADKEHAKAAEELLKTLKEKHQLTDNELNQLSQQDLAQVLAHYDIGRVAIDDSIWNSTKSLDEAQWQTIKRYPALGAQALRTVAAWEGDALKALAGEVAQQHRERWDGTGYPEAISKDQIHLLAQIIAVIDVYRSLTSQRPYREAHDHSQAMTILRENEGKLFDPRVLEAFIELEDSMKKRLAN